MVDIGDELRRALWSEKIPGKSTEAKIEYLLEYWLFTAEVVDQMMEDAEKDNVKLASSPTRGRWKTLLPEGVVTLYVEYECPQCGCREWFVICITRQGTVLPIEDDAAYWCAECDVALVPVTKLPRYTL